VWTWSLILYDRWGLVLNDKWGPFTVFNGEIITGPIPLVPIKNVANKEIYKEDSHLLCEPQEKKYILSGKIL
jgi:hypothetical protein